MTTPYTTIIKKFDDNFTEEEIGNIVLLTKRQHLRNAVSSYMATIGKITANHLEQYIQEDLNEVELLLLSLLMYDSYLDQEIRRYNKVINISNEFMKMSGASMRVKTMREMKQSNLAKINNILTNLI